jgi:hypothetical protein
MARVKAGRNDPCPCGSGKKYKKCCGAAEQNHKSWGGRAMIVAVVVILAGAIAVAITSFGEDPSPVATPGRTWSPEHGHYH